ncbi:LysE family translocator [Neobacillus sp. YIM B06451]|uniref:LysE family translocator n=1 Tax=Neobacillus sp. YIM B06451 TaxID=3070994 RepID=UPI002930088C|nr:LysE family translocator [Neobacillus sp. YIM B06451]
MLTFILVVLMLFLVPGPAVFITISQTVKGGIKTGIVTGLGLAAGDLIHTVAAVAGLSAILMTSSLAFEIVKYMGSAYLIYLGIMAFLERSKKEPKTAKKPLLPTGIPSFRQALLIELLNPKTSLFFLAFLPQFVRSDGPPVTIQLLILGLTFVVMGIVYTTSLVLLTSSIGSKFFSKPGPASKWMGKAVGVVYIGLGLKLALQTQD